MTRERPRVSVVTPFYDAAPYLRECIESVLAQTEPRFEYVLLDNQSTDGSGEIAAAYAARDARIRLVTSLRHLAQIDNFNLAFEQISPESEYVKLLGADDWLYPECLERMLRVAETCESIGLVSSYRLAGTQVLNTGLLPYDRTVFPGREVCRRQLLDGGYVFGSLSSVLYRASLVRAAKPFLDPEAPHADTERAYQTLRDHDFGFVHQVLTYSRVDNASISSQIRDLETWHLERLIILERYGADFLSPDELRRCRRRCERRVHRAFVRGMFALRRGPFLAHHR